MRTASSTLLHLNLSLRSCVPLFAVCLLMLLSLSLGVGVTRAVVSTAGRVRYDGVSDEHLLRGEHWHHLQRLQKLWQLQKQQQWGDAGSLNPAHEVANVRQSDSTPNGARAQQRGGLRRATDLLATSPARAHAQPQRTAHAQHTSASSETVQHASLLHHGTTERLLHLLGGFRALPREALSDALRLHQREEFSRHCSREVSKPPDTSPAESTTLARPPAVWCCRAPRYQGDGIDERSFARMWIASYPRSGNSWLRALLTGASNGIFSRDNGPSQVLVIMGFLRVCGSLSSALHPFLELDLGL
jgi:hypothetical protein